MHQNTNKKVPNKAIQIRNLAFGCKFDGLKSDSLMVPRIVSFACFGAAIKIHLYSSVAFAGSNFSTVSLEVVLAVMLVAVEIVLLFSRAASTYASAAA